MCFWKYILLKISRKKDVETMKLDKLIKYFIMTILLNKLCKKWARDPTFWPFCVNQNLILLLHWNFSETLFQEIVHNMMNKKSRFQLFAHRSGKYLSGKIWNNANFFHFLINFEVAKFSGCYDLIPKCKSLLNLV